MNQIYQVMAPNVIESLYESMLGAGYSGSMWVLCLQPVLVVRVLPVSQDDLRCRDGGMLVGKNSLQDIHGSLLDACKRNNYFFVD